LKEAKIKIERMARLISQKSALKLPLPVIEGVGELPMASERRLGNYF